MKVLQAERKIYITNDGSYRISLPYELKEFLKESVTITKIDTGKREITIKY